MELKGKVHKFGDNISTDDIIAGKYKNRILSPDELATHIMENIDPKFYSKIKKGDFIVAGKNFGLGSSRETAPLVILKSGIPCVIAKSFARIFYRNSINIGLLLLISPNTDYIKNGDEIEIDIERSMIKDITQNKDIAFDPVPKFMFKVIMEGGLVHHFKTHGGFFFGNEEKV